MENTESFYEFYKNSFYDKDKIENATLEELLEIPASRTVPIAKFWFIKEYSNEDLIVARVYNDIGSTFSGYTVIDLNAYPCPTCVFTDKSLERVLEKLGEIKCQIENL